MLVVVMSVAMVGCSDRAWKGSVDTLELDIIGLEHMYMGSGENHDLNIIIRTL